MDDFCIVYEMLIFICSEESHLQDVEKAIKSTSGSKKSGKNKGKKSNKLNNNNIGDNSVSLRPIGDSMSEVPLECASTSSLIKDDFDLDCIASEEISWIKTIYEK